MRWDFRQAGARICVCYNVTNQHALEAWRAAKSPSVEDLRSKFNCGQNCGMCIPYFRTLLSEYQKGKWPLDGSATAADWFGTKKA